MKSKKTLNSLKSGVFSRGLALSKLTFKSGALAASQSIAKLFNQLDSGEKTKKYLVQQSQLIAEELGHLKGSIMKAGQMLALYGEHFLPPEALKVLKTLQGDTPPVHWSQIEKILLQELGHEKLEQLVIENESLASASLGQVHRATIKSSGESIVLKVQYPNLQKVISSDLITIKRLLRLFDLLPKEGKFDELFSEVKEMLIRELDYEKELNSLTAMKNLIGDDPRYILPTPYANFSTKKVLAMSYEPGLNVDSDEVKNWNQERRNRIAQSFLELYFRELFEFRFMQTDPHLGNYRLRINHSGCDSLILYDYGAMKKISEPFWTSYYKVIYGALQHQQNVLLEGAKELGLIKSTDSPELINEYIELCYLFTEPFTQLKGNYNWRESNLPRRVATAGKNMLLTFHFRTPPRDLIFLDRKMAGVYSFLATLSATINGRSIVEKWIK